MKTIICDIDGTLLYHYGSQKDQIIQKPQPLPGVLEKLHEWDKKGYNIILITGRRNCTRKITKLQLSSLGIIYDKLIMGVGRGQRILINDRKENCNNDTAVSFNIKRNTGLLNLEV